MALNIPRGATRDQRTRIQNQNIMNQSRGASARAATRMTNAATARVGSGGG